jgi:hypothetical protein
LYVIEIAEAQHERGPAMTDLEHRQRIAAQLAVGRGPLAAQLAATTRRRPSRRARQAWIDLVTKPLTDAELTR